MKSKEQLRESMEENLCKLKTEIDEEEEKLANVRHELKILQKELEVELDTQKGLIVIQRKQLESERKKIDDDR